MKAIMKHSIKLTNEIRQDASLPLTDDDATAGYLVFDIDQTGHYFEEYREAEYLANRQLEHNTSNEKHWDIFPLYAVNPIVIHKKKPAKKLKAKTVAKKIVGRAVQNGLEFATKHGIRLSTELVGGNIESDRIQYTEKHGVITSAWIG